MIINKKGENYFTCDAFLKKKKSSRLIKGKKNKKNKNQPAKISVPQKLNNYFDFGNRSHRHERTMEEVYQELLQVPLR